VFTYWYRYLIEVDVGDSFEIKDRLFIGRSLQKNLQAGKKTLPTGTGSELKKQNFSNIPQK